MITGRTKNLTPQQAEQLNQALTQLAVVNTRLNEVETSREQVAAEQTIARRATLFLDTYKQQQQSKGSGRENITATIVPLVRLRRQMAELVAEIRKLRVEQGRMQRIVAKFSTLEELGVLRAKAIL